MNILRVSGDVNTIGARQSGGGTGRPGRCVKEILWISNENRDRRHESFQISTRFPDIFCRMDGVANRVQTRRLLQVDITAMVKGCFDRKNRTCGVRDDARGTDHPQRDLMAMKSTFFKPLTALSLLGVVSGCAHTHHACKPGKVRGPHRAEAACAQQECCEETPCGSCNKCCAGGGWCGKFGGYFCRTSNAIPDVLPLGSTVRAHDQVMQTNAEAADFILYRLNFVGQTAELTSDGKDQILEIAARMRSAPFPVIVEREPNNSDPELDALRRNLVAQILTDLGNPDAQQRTVVGTPYGPGFWSQPGQFMYYQHIGNFGNNNNFGAGGGGFNGGF